MRSAWIKWARAVEHQRVLARETRLFHSADTYEYLRTDNTGDSGNPVVRVEWMLHVKRGYPEGWSVLIGDVLANLRAALDHAFWATAIAYSGQPAKAHILEFPIVTDVNKFREKAARLAALVPEAVWTTIEDCQPYHLRDLKHTGPLEVLRWLSNVDKHRFVHIIGRTAFDAGPIAITSPETLAVLGEWRNEGPVGHGDTVARLELARPTYPDGMAISLAPIFAHRSTIQISDDPVEYRTLDSAMDVLRETVVSLLVAISALMEWDVPDLATLELGEEHEAVAPEFGGIVVTRRSGDGTVHRTFGKRP